MSVIGIATRWMQSHFMGLGWKHKSEGNPWPQGPLTIWAAETQINVTARSSYSHNPRQRLECEQVTSWSQCRERRHCIGALPRFISTYETNNFRAADAVERNVRLSGILFSSRHWYSSYLQQYSPRNYQEVPRCHRRRWHSCCNHKHLLILLPLQDCNKYLPRF